MTAGGVFFYHVTFGPNQRYGTRRKLRENLPNTEIGISFQKTLLYKGTMVLIFHFTTEPEFVVRPGKRTADSGSEAHPSLKKKKRGPRKETPLQRFRKQTAVKRKQLRDERKRIDRELRAIEKDLGILKRKAKSV